MISFRCRVIFKAYQYTCATVYNSREYCFEQSCTYGGLNRPDKHVSVLVKKKYHNECLELLQKYQIRQEEIDKYKFLEKDFYVIKMYLQVMEECGVNITAKNLAKFKKIFHEPIGKLKKIDIIPEDVNVLTRSLSFIRPFPFDFKHQFKTENELKESITKGKRHLRPLHSRWSNKGLEEDKDETSTNDTGIIEIKYPSREELISMETQYPYDTLFNTISAVQRQYLSWRLNCPIEEMDYKILRHKILHKYLSRSLRTRQKIIDLLLKDFKFSKQKITNNMYLLNQDELHLEELNDDSFQLAGYPFKQLALNFPRLCYLKKTSLLDIQHLLTSEGFEDQSIKRCIEIFTLTYSTIKSRLECLKQNPDVNMLLHLPRGLLLVFYFKKVEERSKLLKENNRLITLDRLIGTLSDFESVLKEDNERSHGNDLIHYLSYRLDTDRTTIRQNIEDHCHRYSVPLATVRDTLDYLQTAGFTPENITDNLPIVLYPKIKIESQLERISKNENSLTALGFNNGHTKDNKKWFKKSVKSKDKRLALCLYYIEKHYHFTGEGVW